jgi:hypothetical protein
MGNATGLRGRAGGAVLVALVAGLVAAPSAVGVPPVTQVTCAELPELFEAAAAGAAKPGEVAQLPAKTCKVNLVATNTNAFTLEGATGGGTTLEPSSAALPIIHSAVAVAFTLSGLMFTGANGHAAVSLDGGGGVTLNGDKFANDHGGEGGAGVVAISSTQPTVIAEDTFSDDVGTNDGGALSVVGSEAVTVTSNTFSNDRALSEGAALFVGGTGAWTIVGNTFTDNVQSESAGGNGGGGLYLVSEASTNPVQISDNTFDGNLASGEGAGAFIALAQGRTLTATANTLENNRITGANTANQPRDGAGLFIGLLSGKTSYSVVQADNTFAYNLIDETTAGPPELAAGGAGEWVSGVSVQSTADRFVGNRVAVNDGAPPEGGGLGAISAAAVGGSPSVPAQPAAFVGRDDLFSGNSTAAGGWGGAIYVGNSATPDCTGTLCPPTSLTLQDSTLVANSVDSGPDSEGGALWGSPGDPLVLTNSIVFANTPQPEIFGFGASTVQFSDVCSEAGGVAVASGEGNICASPELDPEGSESPASPTVDAGSNALVPAGLSTDIAGNPRILSSRMGCGGPLAAVVDMGAFEATLQGPRAAVPGGARGADAALPQTTHRRDRSEHDRQPAAAADCTERMHGVELAAVAEARKRAPERQGPRQLQGHACRLLCGRGPEKEVARRQAGASPARDRR